ncbi:MAG: hypothetical protein IMZ57_11080 [Acidobacteria bacterium]|nr:hypothetical protein [Acidobacteriota bacterium]
MITSRKTWLLIFAFLGAVLGVISKAFELTINPVALMAGLGSIVVYVGLEAKADRERLRAQASKWKDPKFIAELVAAIVAALGTAGVVLPLPPEMIVGILTAIIAILFKAKPSLPA